MPVKCGPARIAAFAVIGVCAISAQPISQRIRKYIHDVVNLNATSNRRARILLRVQIRYGMHSLTMSAQELEHQKQEELLEAIAAGKLDVIQSAIEETPDLVRHYRTSYGSNYLYYAARHGQTDICEALLRFGFDVNVYLHSDGDFASCGVPLSGASRNGSASTLKLLIAWGAWVDGHIDDTVTPLMQASINGHVEAVRILLDAGANVLRVQPYKMWTALDFSWAHGQTQAAELLMSRGGKSLFDMLRTGGALDDGASTKWRGEHDGVYLAHIHRSVGPVVPIKVQYFVNDAFSICIRVARVAPHCDHKILFTTGLGDVAGLELAVCLDPFWPVHIENAREPVLDWVFRLLLALGAAVVNGMRIDHGTLLSSEMPILSGMGLPEGKTFLVTRHTTTGATRNGDVALAPLLVLAPLKVTKRMSTGEQYLAKADALAMKRWADLALTP